MRNPAAKFTFLVERYKLEKAMRNGDPQTAEAQAARVYHDARMLGLLDVELRKT